MTSENYKNGWVISEKSVDDQNSIPGRVFESIYEKEGNRSLMYILYNDEFPNGDTRYKS